ncbi:helix-hairpin-helix domain-containing protein [soil metagenome]
MNQQNENRQLSNQAIAEHFERVAEMLEAKNNANPFRVEAYRNAAATLRELKQPVQELLAGGGVEALRRLPGIGESLGNSIEQLAQTGQLGLLEQLRGEMRPERVLASVPGIGPKLASRIHETLNIATLSELLTAAYDGRLEQVPGLGRRRIRGIQELLVGRLRRTRAVQNTHVRQPTHPPTVGELLDVDREYREKVKTGELPQIAPRRFNPTGGAWLPVLHTTRANTQYTALYSNTARAHELEMIRDWVVIYRNDQMGNNQTGDGRWTVVTAHYGPLRGKRVVRGRETECQAHYRVEGQKKSNPHQQSG